MMTAIGPQELAIQLANQFVQGANGTSRNVVIRETWNYQNGCVLSGIERVWRQTGNADYFNYIHARVDKVVTPSGDIIGYIREDYNLDHVNEGKLLFPLLRETGWTRYAKAIHKLLVQLAHQPRTKSGGFWHKQIYPYQTWLDGAYMAFPFLAQYAVTFDQPVWLDDVARQIIDLETHTRDVRTGLLYHAWDETRKENWSDATTGCSSQFWGRAMGWFAMAVVDVLDFLPIDHPDYRRITGLFQRLMKSLVAFQDPLSGLWYQVVDRPEGRGNYLESSSSAMFLYALAKGVRKEYLAPHFKENAVLAYRGLLRHRVIIDDSGLTHLTHCNAVAGLGSRPYRDGSYDYYIGERVTEDDPKAVGALMMACTELHILD